MTLTYSEWTHAAEAPPPPQPVFGMRPARESYHLQHRPADRFLSAIVSGGGQIFVAALVIFASMSAIAPQPETQTIAVSIASAQEPVKLAEPPPQVERVKDMTPIIAPPEITIQPSPSTSAPIFVAAPSPATPTVEKAAEEAPVMPPRFDSAFLNNPQPAYPNMSRRLREVGTAQLRVRVSAMGMPLEIQLVKSSGYSRLDESALAAVKKWKFQPAMRGGSAIEDWVTFFLAFGLDR